MSFQKAGREFFETAAINNEAWLFRFCLTFVLVVNHLNSSRFYVYNHTVYIIYFVPKDSLIRLKRNNNNKMEIMTIFLSNVTKNNPVFYQSISPTFVFLHINLRLLNFMIDALCSFCWADVPKEARIVHFILLSLYNPQTSLCQSKKPLPKNVWSQFIARM